jgi:hypothetical protein
MIGRVSSQATQKPARVTERPRRRGGSSECPLTCGEMVPLFTRATPYRSSARPIRTPGVLQILPAVSRGTSPARSAMDGEVWSGTHAACPRGVVRRQERVRLRRRARIRDRLSRRVVAATHGRIVTPSEIDDPAFVRMVRCSTVAYGRTRTRTSPHEGGSFPDPPSPISPYPADQWSSPHPGVRSRSRAGGCVPFLVQRPVRSSGRAETRVTQSAGEGIPCCAARVHHSRGC